MAISFKDLRQELTDEMLKDILLQFNVEPIEETAEFIIFPTCCHNLEGGSPKLYYYKDSKLFHCFTECGDTFDIFTLLQRMYKLRGQDISLKEAILVCDLNIDEPLNTNTHDNCSEDIRYMQVLNRGKAAPLTFKTYDPAILNKYSFDYIGLMPWIKEGISIETLQKFNIKYDEKHNAIIIPNFNLKGDLIGLRARFFNEEDIAKGKYRPVYEDGILYNHPTGMTFYGIYENQEAIRHKHIVVIFEGEKSVLAYNSIYGNNNGVGLATLGQNITRNHIQNLLALGVSDVILAYDTDYEDYKQLQEVEQKYIEKAKILAPYFNVSILMDYEFLLPYKSSPIDGGRDNFEKILKNRRII